MIDTGRLTGRLTKDALKREIALVTNVPEHSNIVKFFHTEKAISRALLVSPRSGTQRCDRAPRVARWFDPT